MIHLLPLHIVGNFVWDEFLVLLVPTTIVLAVLLEKLRMRGRDKEEAANEQALAVATRESEVIVTSSPKRAEVLAAQAARGQRKTQRRGGKRRL